MSYKSANANCAKEMGNYGKGILFEPKSLDMNNMVASMAMRSLSSSNSSHIAAHIGVNDIMKPDTYVYDSDSTPITFSPKWYDEHGITDHKPRNNISSHECIIMVVSNDSYLGSWADYKCNTPYPSICE